MITGTVTYLVRMALPPDAAIDVRLEDVSRADAPAKLIAENIFAAAGKQVPIPFQLPYSPGDIDPTHRYQVRASITENNQLRFTTTTAYPVITNGAPTTVSLVLQPVHGTSGAELQKTPTVSGAIPLLGTTWQLLELRGQPAVPPAAMNIAELMFDGAQNRYSGSTGCNRISGAFELDGDSLHLKAGAMTMMACAEPLMKQEQNFASTLPSVDSYEIKGQVLELLAAAKVVARFKAASKEPVQ